VEAEAEQLATPLVGTVLIYCADYRCNHSVAVMADQWADDVGLSDIEERFNCSACGKRGAHHGGVRANTVSANTTESSGSIESPLGRGRGSSLS
jgi:hypothetical protein